MATEVLESAHAMPQCMYGLHSEGPNGPMARFARVGDKLWHVWDCPSDVYGMLVHSCFVLDGQSNKVLIVDENGCGVDDYVMQTPQYSSDMTRAQQETHVFKFADRITVAFNCQIRLCFINDDACKGVTPPNCDASGRRPSTIGNPSNSGRQNSSNIVPATSNNNTSPSEAFTSTLPSVTVAENVTASGTPPTVISEVPGNKSAGGLDDDLTSDELITTTTQASSTLPIGVTTTNSIATNVVAESSTTTAGITVETNSATTSGFLATDLNELIGILTTVQPDNDTFPTPADLKAFARKSDLNNEKMEKTTAETEKPPSALERLEKVEPEGSGEETQRPTAAREETQRPTDDPATLTIDPALIPDADQLLSEPRGRRNVVKPRLRDIPIVSGRDLLDLDINSELTVLERDDAPPNAFSGDRRAAAQQLEQSPTEMADRPKVCISALGFALLISTALFSVIVCATAIFIGAIRTRKGAKITELIRSVDTRPMSF